MKSRMPWLDANFQRIKLRSEDSDMRIGFTGTRSGMTDQQKASFLKFLESIPPNGPEGFWFAHGDCVGADDDAATIVHESGRGCITCHPPSDEKLRAFNPYSTETLPVKTYFARNRDIVDSCDRLVVCPREMKRENRGGTWYTHDYAQKKGKPALIIWPDGSTTAWEDVWSVLRVEGHLGESKAVLAMDKAKRMKNALQNCRLLAARMKGKTNINNPVAVINAHVEAWNHITRFCDEAGERGSILRSQEPQPE